MKSQWVIAKTYSDKELELAQQKTDFLIDPEVPTWTQSWYADDPSCINKFKLNFGLFWMNLLIQA